MTENGDPVSMLTLSGWVSIWFIMAYILATIIVLCRSSYIKGAIYIITFLLFLVHHFLMRNFTMRIGPECILLLAETTRDEATGFIFQNIFTPTILPTLKTPVAYLLLSIGLEIWWTHIKRRIHPTHAVRAALTLATLAIITPGLYTSRIYNDIRHETSPDNIYLMPYPEDPVSSIYAACASIRAMEACISHSVQITKEACAACPPNDTTPDSLNIVLVIGESYIKWHAQIYGYDLSTTPRLKQEQEEGKLFVFNNVLTPSNLTTEVMKNLLCCNNQSEGEEWHTYPFFPAIFKTAGYEVYFWDNQLDVDPAATYSFTLNSLLYNPDIRSLSYTQTNTQSFDWDGDIIQSYQENVGKLHTPRNLVMFHLIGQHHDVKAHFPAKTFSRFSADSIHRKAPYLDREKLQYIAEYDNATLYNDYVMSQIINIFKQEQTVLIYLSDHGEEVYDYRDQCHRDQEPITPNKLKYQYEIPFVIWCSASYQKAHPETMESIRMATERPFMIDNLCHLLFHLGGIKSPFYKATYDLISPQYNATKRLIKGKHY